MSILQSIRNLWPSSHEPSSDYSGISPDNYYIHNGSHAIQPFNGEKEEGEMGTVKDYAMDYSVLRLRGWQSFIESEVAQAIIKKYSKWAIGEGLKLQSTPMTAILEASARTRVDSKVFTKALEARWDVWTGSKRSSWSGEESLNVLAKAAHKNAKIAGDVLVILRVEDSTVKVELIDSDKISTPYTADRPKLEEGERINHGVRVNARGEHISYFVRTKIFTWIEVNAKDTRGNRVAWMVYNEKLKVDSTRGVPLLMTVMASIKSLTKFKNASIDGAEERAKIPFFIEHNENSTGENVYSHQLKNSLRTNRIAGAADSTGDGVKAASLIASTTSKQVFNMPKGASIKGIANDQVLSFTDFFKTNFGVICAAIDMPVEVALSKYDSNYSASQGALKDWERTLVTDRKSFAEQFYQPILNYWIMLEVSKGTIPAPDLMRARTKDQDLFEAYTRSKFIGSNIPHIDPVKEVKAWREKLGTAGADIPLTTVEQAIEALAEGDFDSTITKFEEEKTEFDTKIGDKMQEKAQKLQEKTEKKPAPSDN